MSWTIEFARTAAKARDRLPPTVRKRVLQALLELAENPYAATNVKALQGVEGFRLRVGDYRVIYTLQNQRLLIHVIRIAHRSGAY